ncbi:MAG: hypothetical protein M1504_03765 [Candidatus Marsarchaeota archaeon]|nr:hypothetical protein [Candidatus Marsarchaeota archaeon]
MIYMVSTARGAMQVPIDGVNSVAEVNEMAMPWRQIYRIYKQVFRERRLQGNMALGRLLALDKLLRNGVTDYKHFFEMANQHAPEHVEKVKSRRSAPYDISRRNILVERIGDDHMIHATQRSRAIVQDMTDILSTYVEIGSASGLLRGAKGHKRTNEELLKEAIDNGLTVRDVLIIGACCASGYVTMARMRGLSFGRQPIAIEDLVKMGYLAKDPQQDGEIQRWSATRKALALVNCVNEALKRGSVIENRQNADSTSIPNA